jgi:hypothetical protein
MKQHKGFWEKKTYKRGIGVLKQLQKEGSASKLGLRS